MLEHEVVHLILLGSVWWRGVEPVDFNGAVVACRREVFVRWVECNALDMTLVVRQRLQFLEAVP